MINADAEWQQKSTLSQLWEDVRRQPGPGANQLAGIEMNTGNKTFAAVLAAATVLAGCVVRQSDLDAWVGMPVEALDTHSRFLTLPMKRSFTESGMEIRNYMNERTVNVPVGGLFMSQRGGCHNIFYIDQDGCVIEYRPTPSGNVRCYTDATLRPQGYFTPCRAKD